MLDPALYQRVRERENRLYPDEMVARLPDVGADDPHRAEWQARTLSVKALIEYLSAASRPLSILELGCGNGWLSRHLSQLADAQVWGIDLPGAELVQAARVSASRNLLFLAANIFSPPFEPRTFDIIIAASVIQYFPDLGSLVRHLRALLKPRGELHVLDSPLYAESELPSARERTRIYYEGMGFPEMAACYFHHTQRELRAFSPRWHFRPEAAAARVCRLLGRRQSPFPWLSIPAE